MAAVFALVTACALPDDGDPSQIVLPPTDPLSTISTVPSSSAGTTEAGNRGRDRGPSWSIGRVVAAAPRVDNSEYRMGSTTPTSPREDTSGFHFSTPDRSAFCSIAPGGSSTLSCRLGETGRPATTDDRADGDCAWSADLVVLNSDGPREGACENRHPVLYRSAIVDFGNTIAVSRFSCLVEAFGMYCLESRSDEGFAVTPTGYRPIRASDPAPSSLMGITRSQSPDTRGERSNTPSTSNTVPPTT